MTEAPIPTEISEKQSKNTKIAIQKSKKSDGTIVVRFWTVSGVTTATQ